MINFAFPLMTNTDIKYNPIIKNAKTIENYIYLVSKCNLFAKIEHKVERKFFMLKSTSHGRVQ